MRKKESERFVFVAKYGHSDFWTGGIICNQFNFWILQGKNVVVILWAKTSLLHQWYIISLIDYRSKWPEVAFTSDISTKTGLNSLLQFSVERVTQVKLLVLVSVEFEEYLLRRHIKHRLSSVYHPERNGEVEWFNKFYLTQVQSARIQK